VLLLCCIFSSPIWCFRSQPQLLTIEKTNAVVFRCLTSDLGAFVFSAAPSRGCHSRLPSPLSPSRFALFNIFPPFAFYAGFHTHEIPLPTVPTLCAPPPLVQSHTRVSPGDSTQAPLSGLPIPPLRLRRGQSRRGDAWNGPSDRFQFLSHLCRF